MTQFLTRWILCLDTAKQKKKSFRRSPKTDTVSTQVSFCFYTAKQTKKKKNPQEQRIKSALIQLNFNFYTTKQTGKRNHEEQNQVQVLNQMKFRYCATKQTSNQSATGTKNSFTSFMLVKFQLINLWKSKKKNEELEQWKRKEPEAEDFGCLSGNLMRGIRFKTWPSTPIFSLCFTLSSKSVTLCFLMPRRGFQQWL